MYKWWWCFFFLSSFFLLSSNERANFWVADLYYFSFFFHFFLPGNGFGVSLRNKEFIYRGLDFERLADFQTRIMAKYPRAELLKYTEPPSENVLNGEGQCERTLKRIQENAKIEQLRKDEKWLHLWKIFIVVFFFLLFFCVLFLDIQLFSVRPASAEEVRGATRPFPERMPPNIRKFHEYNGVSVRALRIRKTLIRIFGGSGRNRRQIGAWSML